MDFNQFKYQGPGLHRQNLKRRRLEQERTIALKQCAQWEKKHRIPRWRRTMFQAPVRHKPKKLSAAKRAQVWRLYAQRFIDKYQGTSWFDRLNPTNRIFTVIRCWCCGLRDLTDHAYGCIQGFEAGHVDAQCFTQDDSVHNLRPICKDCNMKMATMNMQRYARYMEYSESEILQETITQRMGDARI
jgi:hypothetical protein